MMYQKVVMSSYQTFAALRGKLLCISSCWVSTCKIRLGICKKKKSRRCSRKVEKRLLFNEGREHFFINEGRNNDLWSLQSKHSCFFSNFQVIQVIWKTKQLKFSLSWILLLEGKQLLVRGGQNFSFSFTSHGQVIFRENQPDF